MIWKVLKEVYDLLQAFNFYAVALRILLAALLGGLIGFERGRRGRAAGLRTHVLVCLGATMTALTGLYISHQIGLDADPVRISAQVISGIGFLGAGTILTRGQSQVTGLTTAAGLWTTAAIGLAIGFGFYWGVLVAFLVVILTNTFLSRFERSSKRLAEHVYVELDDVRAVNTFFEEMDGTLTAMQLTAANSGLPNHIGVIGSIAPEVSGEQLLPRIRAMESVVIAVSAERT